MIEVEEVKREEEIRTEYQKLRGKMDRLEDDYNHALKVIAEAKELEEAKKVRVVEAKNQCQRMEYFRCGCGGNPDKCMKSRPVKCITPVLGIEFMWCGDYGADGPGTCGNIKAQKDRPYVCRRRSEY